MAAKKRSKKNDEEKAVIAAETPQEKFVRLTNHRVNLAIKRVTYCANLSRYPHTPEQGARVVAALFNAVQAVESAFEAKAGRQTAGFTID